MQVKTNYLILTSISILQKDEIESINNINVAITLLLLLYLNYKKESKNLQIPEGRFDPMAIF